MFDDVRDELHVVVQALRIRDVSVGAEHGLSGVGLGHERQPGRLPHGPHRADHLLAVERAVGPDGRGPRSFELRRALGDAVAHQGEESPGMGVKGHGHEDGDGGHPAGAVQPRQGLPQVVVGLEEEHVRAAVGQPAGLFGERLLELLLGEFPLGAQELPGGADAAGDVLAGRRGRPGQPGRGQVELIGPAREPVPVQLDAAAAEAVGGDDVGTGREIVRMDGGDDLGALDAPDLRAGPFGKASAHQLRAHGPVEEDGPVVNEFQ